MEQKSSHFTFKTYEADFAHGIVRFMYELTTAGTVHEFTEILEFSPPDSNTDQMEHDATLHAILNSLHILLGISYWKTVCPSDIRMENRSLDKKQADFWNLVYTRGLGEFFYKNSIDFHGLVQFPFTRQKIHAVPSKVMSDRSLVLLGSGKDSIVSAELLKKMNKDFSIFVLNLRPIHRETAGLIGKELLEVKRIIDPRLFALNQTEGIFNGHIPITAITSFIGLFVAYLHNFRYVISSNEESANYGNVQYLGSQINHQWSKSFEFESLFGRYIQEYITRDITYFSLLRPLTEFNIVKLFVGHSKYFGVFSSCNKNFKILSDHPTARWCGECPKCAFVFLLLAAFLPKNEVTSIFQQNLLNNDQLLATYKELLGIEGVKPFECVGTPEEVLAAFASILEHGEYKDDAIIRILSFIIGDKLKDKQVILDHVLASSKEHRIPAEFIHVLQLV